LTLAAVALLGCVDQGKSGGSGGSGGQGGQPATGGGPGGSSGGATGQGGTPATGGSIATGGSSGATGGSGTGGTPGTGGAQPTGPYTWKNVAIGGGGFVSGIVFSPAQQGLVYARTDVGGFYRSTDGGAHWTPLTDQYPASASNYLGGESIAPDPTDANIVYAAGGMYETAGNGVILRSTNQGASWTVNPIAVPMGGNDTGRGMGERLAVDPNNNTILYFGSRGSGLYKSTNSGANWTKVTAFPTTGDVAASGTSWGLPVVVFDKRGGSTAGSTTIYVAAATTAAGSNLYHSTDGGTTWSQIAGGPTGLMVHHASVGSDGTVWLAYGNNYGPYNTNSSVKLIGQVWTYAATGTWTNVTPPAANWGGMAGGISVDAQNANHAIVSTLDWYAPDRLLMTTDGGTTWSVIGQPPISGNTAGSTYDDQGAAYWFSANATLIGTNATNWVEAVALDPFNANHAMHGTGAGIWSSSNIGSATGANGQGVTWTFSDTGLEETVPQFMMPSVNGAFLGAIGDLGGMRNTDLDTYSTSGEYTNPIQSTTNGIDFAESNPKVVVRVGNSSKVASDVAYSTDNGMTWTPCAAPPGYTTANKMRSVAVAADGSHIVVTWTSGTGFAAVATANCAAWTATTGLPSGAQVAADRVTPGTFYATSGSTLYASTDGGMTFTSVNTLGTGKGAPRAVFGQAGEVWVAAGSAGLFLFSGQGANKTPVGTITNVTGIGFGAPATGFTHPALFAIGTVGNQYGFWRSDDGTGLSWTRMNDDSHQFGGLQGNYIGGDETHFGRVFLTTGGRGYIYGDPN
jgi:photosystem II stability/assembly factor-like uncharacterized protein